MPKIEKAAALPQRPYTPAISVDAVPDEQAYVFAHNGVSILICNSGGHYFAVENRCSHADEFLACGRIRNGWIACPAHGARFDLATGEALNPPASAPVMTFPLRIVGGMIEVLI